MHIFIVIHHQSCVPARAERPQPIQRPTTQPIPPPRLLVKSVGTEQAGRNSSTSGLQKVVLGELGGSELNQLATSELKLRTARERVDLGVADELMTYSKGKGHIQAGSYLGHGDPIRLRRL